MFKLITTNTSFTLKNVQNILKGFGIVNPNIVRNLRHSFFYLAYPIYMLPVCSITQQIPSQGTTILPVMVPLSGFLGSELGNSSII